MSTIEIGEFLGEKQRGYESCIERRVCNASSRAKCAVMHVWTKRWT
jgi:hypothetical protein